MDKKFKSFNSLLIMRFQSDIFIVLYIYIYCASGTEINFIHREKRQLLFPNSTLLQFNVGIGTPSLAKDVNVNFAFQANFQLPWNRTQIPTDILNVYPGYVGTSRKKRDTYNNDAQLYHLYKYVEDFLNSFGHDGHSCVKQTLCQIGAQPLHSEDEEDLLHELASFVLNPTNDVDINSHMTDQHRAYPYIQAHNHGKNSQNCTKLYEKCNISLVDMFSNT